MDEIISSNAALANIKQVKNLSFVESVQQIISEKGLSAPIVYKRANIDRRLFSRMMSNVKYQPSRDTAYAIALALQLDVAQASELIQRAGYAFSHSDTRDIVIEDFFTKETYDLVIINTVLMLMEIKPIGYLSL